MSSKIELETRCLTTSERHRYQETSVAVQKANYLATQLLIKLQVVYADKTQCRKVCSDITNTAMWIGLLSSACDHITSARGDSNPEIFTVIYRRRRDEPPDDEVTTAESAAAAVGRINNQSYER